MKSGKYNILLAFLAFVFAFSSCTRDEVMTVQPEGEVGECQFYNIAFGHRDFCDASISTKSTNDGIFESDVVNIYVMIFDASGNKIYGKYFDAGNRAAENDVRTGTEECWWVTQAQIEYGGDGRPTHDDNGYKKIIEDTKGVIRVNAPTGTGLEIYALANIHPNYLQLDAMLFDRIQTKQEYLDKELVLKGKVSHRTYMLMTAKAENVSISGSDNQLQITSSGNPINSGNPLRFQRLDAKITVRINVDDISEPANPAHPKLDSFIPDTWEVINLPIKSKIEPNSSHVIGHQEYFNIEPSNFENTDEVTINVEGVNSTVPRYSFSFYMMENMQSPKTPPTEFHQRDKRLKNTDDGSYLAESGDMWEYASEYSTYVKINGRLKMVRETPDKYGESVILYTDVTYYIHLGDFGNDIADYNVKRNMRYTYNVTVKGVNNIEVEVETSNDDDKPFEENNPGATGDVYYAKEEVCFFDAHYGQRVVSFDERHVSDLLTWYVKTPFTPEGATPIVRDGAEILTGLDYKWVKFLKNKVNTDGTYSKKNRWYPGDNYETPEEKLMYVDEFVKYIKDQKRKLDAGQPNDFIEETIPLAGGGSEKVKRIYMTLFIDEYYYEADPFNLQEDPLLWKKFVNKCGDRMMHILCDSKISLDRESSATESVATIIQRPIQTPYSLGDNVTTAWGCEVLDESGFDRGTGTGELDFKINGLQDNYNIPGIPNEGDNGLYNTWQWTLSGVQSGDPSSWYTYFEITGNSGDPHTWELPENDKNNFYNVNNLRDTYRNLRYTFLLRNRDNNGNGIIDPGEIRWYVASLKQLSELYLGGPGISGEAQVYPQELVKYAGQIYDTEATADAVSNSYGNKVKEKWRNHIISSTVTTYEEGGTRTEPFILWGEEGVSTSKLTQSIRWNQGGPWSVRCVRNLGMEDGSGMTNEQYYKQHPDPLIQYTEGEGGVNYFDMSRISSASLRDGGFIDPKIKNLGATDQLSQFNYLPLGFETYSSDTESGNNWLSDDEKNNYRKILNNNNSVLFPSTSSNDISNYSILKYILDNSIETDYPCPAGYRMPNLREAQLISTYTHCPIFITTSTYYSFGLYGTRTSKPDTYGDKEVTEAKKTRWACKNGHITLNVESGDRTRCVRDWNPGARPLY